MRCTLNADKRNGNNWFFTVLVWFRFSVPTFDEKKLISVPKSAMSTSNVGGLTFHYQEKV